MPEDGPMRITNDGPVSRTSSYLSLVVTHLNAPYGRIVTTDDLADALRQGTAYARSRSRSASAIILSMFVESSVKQIVQCASEACADLARVNNRIRGCRGHR